MNTEATTQRRIDDAVREALYEERMSRVNERAKALQTYPYEVWTDDGEYTVQANDLHVTSDGTLKLTTAGRTVAAFLSGKWNFIIPGSE